MQRIVAMLTVVSLLLCAQIAGRAQSMRRLFFNYTGMSFGGKTVLGPGPVTGGSRITASLTLDVPDLRVNITTHDRNGRPTTAARGTDPAIISPSGMPAYLRAWKMSDGIHSANEQNAMLDIRSFAADITPDGIIRTISWDISARSFEPSRAPNRTGDGQSFSLRTGGGQGDQSISNYPNGGNSALQSGPRLSTGTWRVTMLPAGTTGVSAWNPNAPTNDSMPSGFRQFRTIPNGSRFLFRGTKVFIQDASGRLTVPPDGRYRPFNSNYIMVVRGGEKFTYNGGPGR